MLELFIPENFESLLKFVNIGLIDESIINIKNDSITIDTKNAESTLIVYSSLKTDAAKSEKFPEVEIKNKAGEVIDKENKTEIGISNIPLLIKSFAALKPYEKGVRVVITEESMTLLDDDSKFRILMTHPDVLKKTVPGRIKAMDFDVEFILHNETGRTQALLKGMSIIEDTNFSIIQKDKECQVKIGVDISHNYVETVNNLSKKDIEFKKFYNKEHVQSIVDTHKNKALVFKANDKIMSIKVIDENNPLQVEYYLASKKSID